MNSFTQLIRFGDYSDNHKKRIIDFIDNLLISDKVEYAVSVKPYKASKTLQKLGYYWGVVVKIAGFDIGLSSKEMDLVLKNELIEPEFVEAFGKISELRKSIADMKVNEMSDYIDKCVNFLGSQSINIPPPTYKH